MSVGVNSPLSYLLDMHRHAHKINHLCLYEFGMLAKEQIFSEIQSTGYCANETRLHTSIGAGLVVLLV